MYCKIALFLLVVSCFVGLSASQGPGGADGGAGGPPNSEYILNFASTILVDDDGLSDGTFNTSALDIVSHNETHSTIDGDMFIKKDLPPCGMEILVEVYKETNGKLEPTLSETICDLCKELHTGSKHWKYIRYFNLPPQCPFPPGTYKCKDFVPDKKDLPMNAQSAGSWAIDITMFYNPDCDCDKTDNKVFMARLKLFINVESAD